MLRQNVWYFTAFSIFIIIVGLLLIPLEHGDAIHFFSDRRSFFGDIFFFYFTKMGEELVYVVILIILLFVRYKYALTVPVVGLAVSIISLSSKAFFAQPRPMLYYQMRGLEDSINYIEGVILNGGNSSFPSGHTMSAFALYTFFALCWKDKKWTALLIFIIALLVGVSRVYLVQHFLIDIYVGGIMGVLIGVCCYLVQDSLKYKEGHWIEERWKVCPRD